MYILIVKPLFDIFGALLLFILLSPLFFLVLFLLAIQNNGYPFFFQERNGKSGKTFKVIKFKTMNDAVDINGKLLPNSKRLTPIGKLIRSTSLDELPQFINILKGDMSFIGPRPLPVRYYPFFKEQERKRFNVTPGISGLAQVSGRNLLDWDSRLALDVKYVENQSFKLDVWIFFKTIKNVLFKENLVIDPTTKMIDLDVLRKDMKNENN